MYPKLNPEPVTVDLNGNSYNMPRDKLAAAFAGACAAKECILWDMSGFPKLLGIKSRFKEQYDEYLPACIEAANRVGLSATPDTLDYFNPGTHLNNQIADRLEHSDNPLYPFFEEE